MAIIITESILGSMMSYWGIGNEGWREYGHVRFEGWHTKSDRVDRHEGKDAKL